MSSRFTTLPIPHALKKLGSLVLGLSLLLVCSLQSKAQYCTATASCSIDYINNFSTTGGSTNITNNNTGCSGVSGYNNYTAMVHTAIAGTVVNFSCQTAGDYEATSIWVDFDGNQTFSTAENVYNGAVVAPGTTFTGSFTVPLTATPGTWRIRVRCNYNSSAQPYSCGATTWGEIEDYSMTIVSPVPCSGTPTPGTATANPASICYGNTTNLSLTGATLASGLTYQWQYFDGTAWQSVIGGVGATTSSYTTAPLVANTQFRCMLQCGSSAQVYSTPVTVTVGSGGLPYTEGFESITTANTLPPCMSATNLGSLVTSYLAATTYNRTNHTPGGSKFASFRYGCNDYIFTPAFTLTAGQLYQFSYWYIADGYTGWTTLQAKFGNSATAAGQTNVIGTTISNVSNTTYQQFVGTFTPTTTGVYYLSIFCNATGVPWYLTVDDLNLVNLPPCSGAPVAGTITPGPVLSSCPGQTVSLATTGTTTASNLTYQWLQQTNSNLNWVPAVGTGANTPNFTSAVLSDTIRYRLKVTCNNSNLFDTSAAVTVNVPKVVYASLPFVESFETWMDKCSTTDIPTLSWANTPSTGNFSWRRDDQGTSAGWVNITLGPYAPVSFHGSHSARWHSYGASGTSPYTSPGTLDFFVDCSTVSGNKELSFYWINGTAYVNDSLTVFLSTDGGANFTQIGGVQNAANWTLKTIPVTSNSATTVIRFKARIAISTYDYTDIGLDYVRLLPPCAGQPNAGTVSVPVLPCPNVNFNIALAGNTQAAGLTYNWEKSANGTTGWTNGTIVNSNSQICTDNINTPTYYRCTVTCTNASLPNSSVTPAYLVNLAPFYYCYCNSNAIYVSATDNIGKYSVLRQPSGDTVITAGPGTPLYNFTPINAYTDYRYTVPVGQLFKDSLYRFYLQQVESGTTVYTTYAAGYIDYNRDGTFQPAERIFTKNPSTAVGLIVNDTFRVPDTAAIGLTGMRIILSETNPINPCGTYSYGETEDYLMNVNFPPCNGPAGAGTALSTDSAMCPNYYFTLTDTTHQRFNAGLVWVWQTSPNFGNTWTNVAGSDNRDTMTMLFTNTAWYRLRMICSYTHDTTYSNNVKINLKPPYKCYCYSIAVGVNSDTSDIGAFSIGNFSTNTGGPHVRNPEAKRGRTDYTDLGPIVLYRDTTYEMDVYHTMRSNTHGDARITVFMDFNNNLQYDIPQEAIYLTTANPGSDWMSTLNNWYVINHIKIPHAAIPNVPTGMRVIINNDVSPNAPSETACGTYISGETEDYTVMFKTGFPTGVNEIHGLEDLALYPNPTDGAFTISFSTSSALKDVKVTITDVTGRNISEMSYGEVNGAFTKQLDLSAQAKGVYFVEIKADNQKIVKRVVVK